SRSAPCPAGTHRRGREPGRAETGHVRDPIERVEGAAYALEGGVVAADSGRQHRIHAAVPEVVVPVEGSAGADDLARGARAEVVARIRHRQLAVVADHAAAAALEERRS